MRIFLTGYPGSGKSTVLMKVIELLKQKGLKVGGFVTPELRERNKRVGFCVEDIHSVRKGILASTEVKTGPKLGKYKINVKEFENIALKALDFAVENCDLVAIDEIGKMEWFSEKFREKIIEILNSEKPVIAVLHRNFVNRFKKYGKVIEVTLANREKLPEEIVKEMQYIQKTSG
jgi:nucleoside-triphosphatase